MAAGRGFRHVACWLMGLAVSFCFLLPLPAGRAYDHEVDLALVLAIDCSFSVDSREYDVQMRGLGEAFMNEAVKRAIAQGLRRRIAVAVVQWSDDRNQKIVVPWTVVSGDAGADELGEVFINTRRQLTGGGTSLSTALVFSASLFAAAPTAGRLVIDVSTDGRNNSGPPVAPVRDHVVAQGVTINGLTILNEWPTLDTYFENNAAGGPGHFVIPANDYDAYAEAILRKLVREITGPGIT
ncbi:DUF1194 domain-containing protein [Aestuariivirga sp.]|uniref:DUF1194 domain-containing protein n=1 Tax=Aestuariivirga sp. TaxID=2650926 RepID=UPI0025B9BAFE|nr:DUF1194 domain-containing protein [Aestuariivirga sp.]MCA3556084.1 DUF1194 domain-containing protein [Aestuariivirga sp.]